MKAKIIDFLQAEPGKYVSGAQLSTLLGVSRTAIWKHIQQLRQMGYVIDSSPQKGYQLVESPDYLYPWEVAKGLQTSFLGRQIHHVLETESTNDWAKAAARAGELPGTLFIAERQTQGRGRRGRTWLSPQGGLYFSFILRPKISPRYAPQIGIVIALGLYQALTACS